MIELNKGLAKTIAADMEYGEHNAKKCGKNLCHFYVEIDDHGNICFEAINDYPFTSFGRFLPAEALIKLLGILKSMNLYAGYTLKSTNSLDSIFVMTAIKNHFQNN